MTEILKLKTNEQTQIEKIVDWLPETFKKPVVRIAEATNTPQEWSLIALLGTTSGAIGTGAYIRYDGYSKKYGNLYCLIIAEQGGAKTPVVSLMERPLQEIQLKLIKAYQKELKDFKENKEAKESDKPIKHQFLLGDETQENIIYRMKNHPKGILWSPDEMSHVLDKTYSGKDIIAFLLKVFENKPYSTGRVTTEDIDIETTYMSITYTTQPETAKKKFLTEKNLSNGFCARHLITSAKELPPTRENKKLKEGELDAYFKAISNLYYQLKASDPVEVTYDKEAEEFLTDIEFLGKIKRKETHESSLKGFHGKILNNILKIALNLHMMKWADSQVTGKYYDKTVIKKECFEIATEIAYMTIEDFDKQLVGADDDIQEKMKKYIERLITKGQYLHDQDNPSLIVIELENLKAKARGMGIHSVTSLEKCLRKCPELGYLDKKKTHPKATRAKAVFYLSIDFIVELFGSPFLEKMNKPLSDTPF